MTCRDLRSQRFEPQDMQWVISGFEAEVQAEAQEPLESAGAGMSSLVDWSVMITLWDVFFEVVFVSPHGLLVE